MSLSKQVGGVGIQDLSKRNRAFGGKLVWSMYTKPQSLWCQIMQAKYLNSHNPARIFKISNPPQGSTIWNFMISCREVVSNFLSWQVHSGEDILFWKDSWNGFPPLSQHDSHASISVVLSQLWGVRLVDYVDSVDLFSHKVSWKDPSTLPLSL